ncbi:zinc finger protein 148-like isoform X2 [Hypanus sabinus]|uniref:zinc finger protein 148-like isoform X2 n=1 Tax=Hypanus sabinus TaxID=79690 RepID=UPI0028C3DC21|nr:zinc finger protein 148-like isoform X2 [Hypanus sabinus]
MMYFSQMSRVDGISDHPSVPTGGQQSLLEYSRTPQQTPLIDNVMLQDNSREVGILQDSSVSHEVVGSHSLLQSSTINHQQITDSNPVTQNALGSADETDNHIAVTVTRGLPCAPEELGKTTVLDGVEQFDEKQREQEDLEKLQVNENLLKLRENEDMLKLRQHEELMKLREHEDLLKKQKSKKVGTTSKIQSSMMISKQLDVLTWSVRGWNHPIKHLFCDGRLMTFEELMNKYSLAHTYFLQYFQILVVGEDGTFMVKSPKTHICEQCSAAFRTNYHLQRHILIHTGEKPYQCTQCSMRFIQKYLLQRHEKIHTGEKPFHCDECDMRFIQKYHMERHKRTHSGEKPYQCEYCLQYFSRTDRLLKHRRMCRENQAKASDKNPAVKTEPIILAINSENRLLPSQKDVINPTSKKLKTEEKLELETCSKAETSSPTDVNLNKRECMEYYTSTLKIKDEYKVEQSSLITAHSSQDSAHLGATYQNLNPPKLILKRISSNKTQKTTEHLNQTLPVSTNFDATKVTKYTYAIGSNPNLLVIEGQNTDQGQDASRKPGGSHNNYDDAMQFVKKKRFLQGPNSTSREFALSVGQIAAQPAVTQAVSITLGESSSGTSMLVQLGNSELKSSQDKSGIPDEVLQTLLDHYTNKPNGQVPFSVSDTQVAPNITVSSTDSSNVPPLEQVSESSQPASTDNCNMLHEYSKFLQQALERTCHNDSYSSEHGLVYETEAQPLTGSLQVPPLFSSLERQVFATMVTQHGFRPEVGSSLRLPAQKSQYGLLVGESQHPFAFIPTVASNNTISSLPDFTEQVSSQKKRQEPAAHNNHHLGTFGQDSRFSATGGEMTPSFSDNASGQMNLRVRQGNSNYSEFPLVNVPDGRDQMSASPAATGGSDF